MLTRELDCQVCIAGGGPAGMMLAYLLARAGIETLVIERHADFLRDFRGDTVHPSTLECLHELGLLERFLERPHQKVTSIRAMIGDREFCLADFSKLKCRSPFLVFVPQWDFLDFLHDEAATFPSFRILMNTQVQDLISGDSKIRGVRAKSSSGEELRVRAELVIGADGRHSMIREKAALPRREFGAPIDVLWMRLSRKASDPPQVFGRIAQGQLFVMLNRDTYWQCAYIIPKGALAELKAQGLRAFYREILAVAPFLAERIEEPQSWDDIKLLTVRVDRLLSWAREGLLCIGDSAHAMSPVGGVGINLAIQDAIAAANILTRPLQQGRLSLSDLIKVEQRRQMPTRLTQWAQLQIHKRILSPVLINRQPLRVPLAVRLLDRLAGLQKIPAYLIGIGALPEHIDASIQAIASKDQRAPLQPRPAALL